MRFRAVILLMLLVASIIPGGSSGLAEDVENGCDDAIPSRLRGSILIIGDDQFNSVASNLGWNGTGSGSDPYIIENLEISANGLGYGIGIKTNYTFIIRNCTISGAYGGGSPLGAISILKGNATIHNNTVSSSGYGIRTYGSAIVTNNTARSCNMGIWVIGRNSTIIGNRAVSNTNQGLHYQGSHSLIKGNYIFDNDYGIHVYASQHNRLENNTMEFNDDHGIRLDFSSNNVIIDNHADSNDDGIYLNYGSDNNLVVNNTIKNCEEAILLQNGVNNTFYGNEMQECSFLFKLEDEVISSQIIPMNNTVGGKPVHYMIGSGHDSESFDNDEIGQLIAYDVEDLEMDNTSIENGSANIILFKVMNSSFTRIETVNCVYNMVLAQACQNLLFDNVSFKGGDVSIEIYDSSSIDIINPYIWWSRVAIQAEGVEDLTIYRAYLIGQDEGIWISRYCSKVSILNCGLTSIHKTGIVIESPYCLISNNYIEAARSGEITGNATGMKLMSDHSQLNNNSINRCRIGVKIINSDQNQLMKNFFYTNQIGIQDDGGTENFFINNHLESNIQYGIVLMNSIGTQVTENSISNSTEGGILISRTQEVGIQDNELVQCSLDIYYEDGAELPGNVIGESNTVNGKPVYYYEGQDLWETELPDDGGQYIFFESSARLRDINLSGVGIGVWILNTNLFLLENLMVSGPEVEFEWPIMSSYGYGVKTLHTSSVFLFNCSFSNLFMGIMDEYNGGIYIENCSFEDIRGPGVWSRQTGSLVSNSSFVNCSTGIEMVPGLSIKVELNQFLECGTGILIGTTSRGIRINHNIFQDCVEYGINITEGAFNEISKNGFSGNGLNHIFIDSKQNVVRDNYYSDHVSPDLDNNGEVDIPYDGIGGNGNATDPTPRRYVPDVIFHSPDRIGEAQYLQDVILSWDQKVSRFLEVERYIINRTGDNVENTTWEIDGDNTEYLDRNVEEEGRTDYQVWAVSSIGLSEPEYFSVSIDNSPISVHFNQVNGSIFDRRNVTLYWTIEDGGAIREQILTVDGNTTLISPGYLGYTIEFTEAGVHEISIQVRDHRGFTSTDTISIIVDWEKPILNRGRNDIRFNDTVELKFNITENYALKNAYFRVLNISYMALADAGQYDPTLINLMLDGQTRSGAIPPPIPQALMEGNLSFDQSSIELDLPEGNYSFTFFAEDVAGNTASNYIIFGVDKSPPEITYRHPDNKVVQIDTKIIVEVSDELLNGSITMDIYGIHGNWKRIDNRTYEFTPSEDLEHFREYLARFSGTDLFGNKGGISWTFSTMKDPERMTTVTGRIVGANGEPLEDVHITISNLTGFGEYTDENGYFTFDIAEGMYVLDIFSEGYLNSTVNITVPYMGGPVDIGTLTIDGEDDTVEKEPFPWFIVIVGILLIIVTIYFAISAFTRKGGPLGEE